MNNDVVWKFEKNGIIFNVFNSEKGEITIKMREKSVGVSMYGSEYKNPPIPKGYKYVYGRWFNGLVIERESDGSQFVWVPVSNLESNGTLDGKSFCEKFGRRIWDEKAYDRAYTRAVHNEKLLPIGGYLYGRTGNFVEPFVGDIVHQFESVKKYGGYYLSRFLISENRDTGKLQSVRGGRILFVEDLKDEYVVELGKSMERQDSVKSHLIYGAEFDTTIEWLLECGQLCRTDILEDSANWCNRELQYTKLTGKSDNGIAQNICDFSLDVPVRTQEISVFDETPDEVNLRDTVFSNSVNRGLRESRDKLQHSHGTITNRTTHSSCGVGMRVALWVK